MNLSAHKHFWMISQPNQQITLTCLQLMLINLPQILLDRALWVWVMTAKYQKEQ